MRRILAIAVTALALASCSTTLRSSADDAAKTRAQLLALADDPATARIEGLDSAATDAPICGRLFDTGPGRQPVRFVLEPLDKRVLLDPASSQSIEGAEATIERCEAERDKRASTFESREAACRPAEVVEREVKLRRAFERRFAAVCG